MRVGRNLIILTIAAILAGAAAVYLANRYISSRVQTAESAIRDKYSLVEVVVPNRSLKAGDIVNYSNMATRKIPRAFLNTHAITPDTFSSVAGRQLAVPVESGNPLLRAQVSDFNSGAFSARVEKNDRAITVPVDTVSSVGGLLSPGDHVDILFTAQSNNGKAATVPLLQNVEVLATGTDYLSANHESYRDVTFQLDSKDASRLLLAQRVGDISTTLRGPNHSGPTYDKPITPENLFKGQYAYLFGPPPKPAKPPEPPSPPPKPVHHAPPPISVFVGNKG